MAKASWCFENDSDREPRPPSQLTAGGASWLLDQRERASPKTLKTFWKLTWSTGQMFEVYTFSPKNIIKVYFVSYFIYCIFHILDSMHTLFGLQLMTLHKNTQVCVLRNGHWVAPDAFIRLLVSHREHLDVEKRTCANLWVWMGVWHMLYKVLWVLKKSRIVLYKNHSILDLKLPSHTPTQIPILMRAT